MATERPSASLGFVVRRVLISPPFRALSFAALTFALLGGGFCVVLDLPDDPSTDVVDTLMCMVTAFFVIELLLRCIGDPSTYPRSGFFLIDIVGALSMIFEVSFLLGYAGRDVDTAEVDTVNGVLLRGTRVARLGARIGRLSKLMRCTSMLYCMPELQGAGHHTRMLNKKLMMVLSTKASVLTVVLMLAVPLFSIGQYPEADLSLAAWSSRLEADYAATANLRSPDSMDNPFRSSVREMLNFYQGINYQPYLVEGFPEDVVVSGQSKAISGASLVTGAPPKREENIVRQQVPRCQVERDGCTGQSRAAVYFDFTGVKRYSAAMDLSIIALVVLIMALESLDLSHTINSMVARPLEKLMETIHVMKDVLQEAATEEFDSEMNTAQSEKGKKGSGGGGAHPPSETQAAERVLEKLGRLLEVFMREDEALANRDIVDMDDESRGVIVEILQHGQREAKGPRHSTRLISAEPSFQISAAVKELPVDPELISSWDLDILGLDAREQDQIVCHVLYDSDLGQATGRAWTELGTLQAFVQAARAEHQDNPYHCFAHACDVVASCSRLLRQVQWELFLGDLDVYALLVAGICHDVGHPGKTNPFLVETGDALAMRYNDRSPLENMHCAKLFDILRDPCKDIFSGLGRDAYKQARTVCITAILHTDNAQHFDMVKEVKKVFEVSSDLCNSQALDPENVAEPYLLDVLRKQTLLWHKLFLHLADISNPLKPFWIYMLWAARVMDEFFAQGDEEKRIGIPVGMLNDRDKVSRPGSEHGFITFLVAPLVTATISVFPPIGPLACQMASNLESWRNLWVQQAKPSPEDIQKRDADVQKIREQVGQRRTLTCGATKNL